MCGEAGGTPAPGLTGKHAAGRELAGPGLVGKTPAYPQELCLPSVSGNFCGRIKGVKYRFALATFQVGSNHVWLTATKLESKDDRTVITLQNFLLGRSGPEDPCSACP